ncbi:hypothetical protein [Streptomyces xantholiticus]|uniref:hypothetical protein n=1 Tax=Streptomyces xantholiticus TaxID=68285 RepID=UPI00167B3177|nr:hypothetical protein [Streptomyces xantholiticus]GGW64143.1 hypothetical protein GCM10010381_56440 [Streptomyces xantholiticus]
MPVTRRLVAAAVAAGLAVPALAGCGSEPRSASRGIYALGDATAEDHGGHGGRTGPKPTAAAVHSGKLAGRFTDYAYQRISASSMVLFSAGAPDAAKSWTLAKDGLELADSRLAEVVCGTAADRTELLGALRTSSAALLDWARATGPGKGPAADAERQRLEDASGPVAEAAVRCTPGVAQARLATSFAGIDRALTGYLTEVKARKPAARQAIRVPGAKAYDLARAIAPGAVRARGLGGDLNAPQQAAYAELNQLMVEHFWLTNNYVVLMVSRKGNATDPAVAAGAGMLDDNSRDLMNRLGQDPDTRRRLLTAWRIHVDLFIACTRAGMRGDKAGQKSGRERLDRFRHTQAELLADALPGTSAPAISSGLAHHVTSALSTADAFRGGNPKTLPMLFASSEHMAHLTDALVRSSAFAKPDPA